MTMNEKDFREIILEQRKNVVTDLWTGTTLEYLYKVQENPVIAQFAPGRIYNAIDKLGVTSIPDDQKLAGYEDLVKYKFFDQKIFGTLEPIHDIMRFLKAAARRTETGKRILILVGPVSSGKSTIAYLVKRGLEADDTPKYVISGCPIHEEPLHLIPMVDRPSWEEKLGVKIEGHLCPVCRANVDKNFKHNWEDVPVERFIFSEQHHAGIGTFAPSDPKSQDVSELIGRINLAKLHRFGEDDPQAYLFNGELQVANGGVIDFIELLKTDSKLLYVLLTAAQEQLIKAPGFPQMYIDTLILAHTNQTEYDAFKADKKNEALHDRMYPIYVPWNLKVDDEVKIYEKLIRESQFKGIHISPNTLEVAAKFAILTRLKPSTKVSSLLDKMRLYNDELPEGFKRDAVDVRQLRQEGRADGEGMSGISPRFIINALNIALGAKEEKKCINPIDIIRGLYHNFDHQIGITPEDKKAFLDLLKGDKVSALAEFKLIANREVMMSFVHAYEPQAQEMFENYMQNAGAFCRHEKVKDGITGEYSEPDEKLMRSIEECIAVPVNSSREFRQAIFVQKSTCLERGEAFNFKSYGPLKEAIEKRLITALKDVVMLTLADTTRTTDRKVQRKRNEAIDSLKERGYCEHCAYALIEFVGMGLRKEK